MKLGLEGRTALVTGATRGIGLAIARTLREEGMRVYGAARTPTAELSATGAHTATVDLTTAEGPERLVREVVAEFGTLDVLVNNAGGGEGADFDAGGFLAEDDETWRRSWELNLLSAVRTTRAALPALLDNGGGVLINISTTGARVPGGPVAYNTAKAGLTTLGKALSEEFGPRGLRVNTVSPGPTRTPLWEDPDRYGARLARKVRGEVPENGATDGPEALDDFLRQVPDFIGMTTGRFAEPSEIAALVAFLCSPYARNIAGSDIAVDGGSIKTV